MGTKNNPGSFDCYANADPDEPMFILLARDVQAPGLVEMWAETRELNGENPDKVAEAMQCAESMRRWYNEIKAAKFAAPTAELFAAPHKVGCDCPTCRHNKGF